MQLENKIDDPLKSSLMLRRLTQRALKILDCVSLDYGKGETSLWVEDMGVHCYSVSHTLSIIFVAVPVLLIVCFAFPVIVFATLRGNKGELRSKSALFCQYGYFHRAYKQDYAHFWDSLVHIRKFLLATISVLPHTYSNKMKGYFAGIVLLFSSVLQAALNPLSNVHLDNMETGSLLISSLVCLLSGVSNSPEGMRLEFWISFTTLLLILIFAGCLAFVYCWLRIRLICGGSKEHSKYDRIDGVERGLSPYEQVMKFRSVSGDLDERLLGKKDEDGSDQ